MLAKVRLFRKNWSGALEAIENFDLITDVYDLEENYADLFKAGAENSVESVLSIRYINNNETSIGNNLNVWFSPASEGGYYFDAPTQSYVDCFDELTATGETDPRLDASIGRDGQPWFNGTTFSSSWSEATGYLVKKYNEDISEEFAKSQSTVPQHLIRYADVLLIKAEALNENNQTTLAAVELDKVRARAGLAATTASGQAEMRDAIRKERRRELGFEFHRFFDVMRYGKEYAEKALGSDLKWQEPRFFYPIPQAETDANAALNK
jgi:DNA-binding transcriptional ArsR family regulator